MLEGCQGKQFIHPHTGLKGLGVLVVVGAAEVVGEVVAVVVVLVVVLVLVVVVVVVLVVVLILKRELYKKCIGQ